MKGKTLHFRTSEQHWGIKKLTMEKGNNHKHNPFLRIIFEKRSSRINNEKSAYTVLSFTRNLPTEEENKPPHENPIEEKKTRLRGSSVFPNINNKETTGEAMSA